MCWYERGAVYDKRCRYKLGIFTIIPEEKRIATLEKLWREDKMAAAATMLGKIYYGNKDYDRAAKYYKYAREQNDPAGWYATGHMIKSKELVLENLTYLDCWEQAGNLGYDMGYYSMLQSIDLRSEERRRRVLEAQVKLGVEAEMITLGKDYFNEGRKEEGLSLLMNAGVDGARALESMIKEGVLKRENVQEHLKNTTRANMIRDLRSLSKLE
jgi:tetratricopeptide (TPR) repeat protein